MGESVPWAVELGSRLLAEPGPKATQCLQLNKSRRSVNNANIWSFIPLLVYSFYVCLKEDQVLLRRRVNGIELGLHAAFQYGTVMQVQ